MRILLDENIPRGLRRILQGHDVRTASEMGLGQHRERAIAGRSRKGRFEALVTSDQNFVFQQNLAGRNIAVVVLSTNRWATIRAQPQTVQRSPTPLPELSPASPCPAASAGPGRLRI